MEHEPIAIIGSGCRFPGEASTPSKLWQLLRQPRDVSRKIDRFNYKGFYHPDGAHHGTTNVQDSYLLAEDHRVFDAQFFNIKPVEADAIDPMQRILLETVYESLENAGQTIQGLQGSDTAFYVGVMSVDYVEQLLRDLDALPTYFATGTSRAIVSNRVSYFFDWHGPSMTIDTACSSSLIALHQAVQTLRTRESRVAVAAGADLILGPEVYIGESKLNMLSPSGLSRMWDSKADGYARGEGFASVVCKRLSDAIADGDYIECIVRETATNQDGRTKGITMPNPAAQMSMIRGAYARAGLDLNKQEDRPQYFEAHGTGTPAGDPLEAEAIYKSFFGLDIDSKDLPTLEVGSVKTVIGHTEGTAGLAGVMKASLALQHGIIPPNLLFESLSPSVAPFYQNLHIPTVPMPWPKVAPGCPRRASVNSFGFGGSNAHAILESYEPTLHLTEPSSEAPAVFTPVMFSATTERSLAATMAAFFEHLKNRDSVNLRDVSWTMSNRRSQFNFRAAISASTTESLVSKIDGKLEAAKLNPQQNPLAIRSTNESSPRILGVFTGQGAQWPSMGKELIMQSKYVKQSFQTLEGYLAQLPESDRPSWSLTEQLIADPKASRLGEATVAQPLCTALQIVLVDLLKAAGVKFSAVVGHSSGEIGAAYAAGYLAAPDALKIAYYRGVHTGLAGVAEGRKGAMLAAGTSLEDAQALCALPFFDGRMRVAASNSSSSVTLSGDADAIAQAKLVFEDEKKFARLLKVDKAYHSHHMYPCSEPYVASLKEVGIKIQSPDPACTWFSSVEPHVQMKVTEALSGTYWRDNMVNTVQFSRAVESAVIEMGKFDLAIEVGPHPALKGPATQTIQETSDNSTPYSGVLSRGSNDVEALSEALGFVWSHLGSSGVDFASFDRLIRGGERNPPKFVPNLPSYSWDHDRIFWSEGRAARQFRSRDLPPHPLLGSADESGTERETRWRNYLLRKEIPWLEGHQVQNQMVFPAAGYVSMAVEASKTLAKERSVQCIELLDLDIGRAITFDDEDSGIEILCTLATVPNNFDDENTVSADFMIYACLRKDAGTLTLMADCRVQITLGEVSRGILPIMPSAPPNMLDIDLERFYQNLTEVGLNYRGPFRTMSFMQRKLGFARGTIAESPVDAELMIQPPTLDIAFHGVMATWFFPGDGRLWRLMLPRSIKKITVNPSLRANKSTTEEAEVRWNSILTDERPGEVTGNVDIFASDDSPAVVQIEGLKLLAFQGNTAADDRQFYSEIIWDTASLDAEAASVDEAALPCEIELATACERVAFYFWRMLNQTVSSSEDHHKLLLKMMTRNLSLANLGKHPTAKKEWCHDTKDQIMALVEKYPQSIDMRLLHDVGEHLPGDIAGRTLLAEHVTWHTMLERLYTEGLGISRYNNYTGRMARQMAHRYPHMNVLEIGAGTGSLTAAVLEHLGEAFYSYTFTDKLVAAVENAQKKFASRSRKMAFKPLDIESDPIPQGFPKSSYDLIVAPMTLQMIADMGKVMTHLRSLVKPGGQLLLQIFNDSGPMRLSSILGCLPDFWLGTDDGRSLTPHMSASRWNSILRKSGFSGVDIMTPNRGALASPFLLLGTQAVNQQINYLRRPLLQQSSFQINEEELCIIGGDTIETSRVVEELTSILQPRCSNLTLYNTVEDIDATGLRVGGTVICLADLDEPLFKNLSPTKWENMKQLFDRPRQILWLTRGRMGDDPYSSMTIGFWRSVAYEAPHVRVQFLDIDATESLDPYMLAETYLRTAALELWSREGQASDLLWSREPELRLQNGKLLIPRAMPQQASNDRYNAERRDIKINLVPAQAAVQIERFGDSYRFRETYKSKSQDCTEQQVVVRVKYSLLSAIKAVPAASLYLGLGTMVETGEEVLVFSESNASLVAVPRIWTTPCNVPRGSETSFLLTVVGELLTTMITMPIPTGGVLVLHEPNSLMASIFNAHASKSNIRVVCVTSDANRVGPQWTYVHARASQHTIVRALPANVSTFVDLLGGSTMHGFGNRIAAALPDNCKKEKVSTLLSPVSKLFTDSSLVKIPELLGHVTRISLSTLPSGVSSLLPDAISPHELLGSNTVLTPFSILEWSSQHPVPVTVEAISPQSLFSKLKTYFLVGLTGEIGRSITQWMAENGAGYIVMTSRNPNVDPNWLRTIEATGATVKVFAMDVTDKESLQSVYDEVSSSLPPIAGVANAAMVLRDQLFADMDLKTMELVLRPKVDGTNSLNELFQDTPLDFFILFSSLSCVIGNEGQSNYSAANMYMTALAAQRRKNGLAASVMDIGRVVGVGYLRRGNVAVDERLARYGMMAVSETDLHHQFAEAVVAGRPGSNRDSELISGLAKVEDDENDDDQMRWAANPVFSHFVGRHKQAESKIEGRQARTSLKVQLETVTSEAEALDVIQACFALKLQNILQLAPAGLGKDIPLVELGVDSLVAVEVRTWFLKELQTDMPILKILGGSSVADLCCRALEKLPKDLLPAVGVKKQVPARHKPARTQNEAFSPKITEQAPYPLLKVSNTADTTAPSSYSISPLLAAQNSSEGDSWESNSTSSLSSLEGDSKGAQNATATKIVPSRPTFQKVERQSFSQSRFWFLKLYIKDQATFNVTFYHRITGSLDIVKFAKAVATLGRYHELLRTAFFAEQDHMDTPMQGVMDTSTLHLEHKKISNDEQAVAEYERMKAYIYDLEQGETVRILLLSQSSTNHFIIFGHPHILMDGVSFQVLLGDLEKLYNNQMLSPSTLQYADFSARQRKEIEMGSMSEEVAFWRKEYPDIPRVLPLFPMTKSSLRKVLTEYKTNSNLIRLDKGLATRIKAICIKHKVTSFHFYLAAFRVLLFRFLDTEDLSIGIADANRKDSATLGSIGLYLNLLPLRFRSTPNASFSDTLREARTKSYSALEHSRLPFDIILDELNVPRSALHSPLFQAFFDYRQGAKENPTFSNVQFQIQDAALGQTAYDISLDVTESSAGPLIMMKAQDYLYSKSTTETILRSYVNLLEAFSTNVNMTHEQPSLFKETDIKLALQLGRGPPMQSTWPETLVHRIDDMIADNGHRLALKDGSGRTLSYKQMAQRANSIAAEMLAKGVTPGSKVAVFQVPTSDWICSLLAILRIGAVYVPLDLRNPLPRLAAIAKASEVAAILAQAATVQDAPALGAPTAVILDVSNLAESTISSIPNQAKADALAVTLFTSGSTGTPKGILLPHRTLRNEIEGYTKMWNIGAETILQQSAFSFDLSMDQIFTALATGGTLIVVPKTKRGDSVAIAEIIRDENITYTKATPSEYSSWIEFGAGALKETSKWKLAFSAGESLTANLLREFRSLQLARLRLINCYGPAEATMSSTKIELPYNGSHDANEPIPAGYALPNYTLYIVDKHLNGVPVGMPGQIAIGGAGLGFGYLNEKIMTAQKFVPNPFASDDYVANGWSTMFLTGDKGRLRDDGALLFDGRVDGDTQIKLRGLRIELKDIESTIVEASQGHLVSAIVTVRGESQFLVAHVVFSPTFDSDDRENFLRQLMASLPLPPYMIPAMAMPLESMPLNNHSKIDRIAVKNLPLLKASQSAESKAELTETELQLKHLWEKTVSRDISTFHSVDPSTNFFHIGGNSLLLVKLQSMIRETFNVALPLLSLFDVSSLGEMATKIQNSISVSTLDWEEETSVSKSALVKEAVISSVDRSSHPKPAGRTVVLTGATGYLGKYLLHQLDADSTISKVVCIAVRSTGDDQARELPVKSSKVVSCTGDLTAPLLGLSRNDFANLARDADTIIHCGARRSFWDNYHQLRKVNFFATREIVKLAFARRIPIHFTSSAGVMHLAGSAEPKIEAGSVSTYLPPVDGSDGYVASKWASEKYLENACRELDIPVTINRFVPADHKIAAPPEILQEFLKYANAMHTLPSQDGWDGEFDLIPAHNVARDICNATNPAVSPTTFGTLGDVRFTHHKSEIKISVKEVFAFVAAHKGREAMATLPSLKWIGRIKKMGFGYLFASHDVVFHGKGEGSASLVSRR